MSRLGIWSMTRVPAIIAAVVLLVSCAGIDVRSGTCRGNRMFDMVASGNYEDVIRAADSLAAAQSTRLSAALLMSWGAGGVSQKLEDAMREYRLDERSVASTIVTLKRCADTGNTGAAMLYGMAAHAELVDGGDQALARDYFERALAAGNSMAALGVAVVSYQRGDRGSFEKEIHIAQSKNPELTDYLVGVMFLQGIVFPFNTEEAAHWVLGSAKSGNPDAQGLIALMYSRGVGVPLDSEKSNYWLKAQAENSKQPKGAGIANHVVEEIFKSSKK